MGNEYINNKSIAILLSTYNGEKFVAQQIESIINQTVQDFTLYVRDDKSTDNTLNIINSYKEILRDRLVIIPSRSNFGSKKSFLHLLQIVSSKYYMFCDQDDVWLPEKISISLEAMSKAEAEYFNKPIIVHTDLHLVDGNLDTISSSYWNYKNMRVDKLHTYAEFCHYNDVTGCTMFFNHKVKEVTNKYLNEQLPYYMHHDHFLSLLILNYSGIIIPVHNATMLFRRHGGNSTNPLAKNESIFHHPQNVFAYFDDQYKRWCFFNRFKPQTYLSFIYNKVKMHF